MGVVNICFDKTVTLMQDETTVHNFSFLDLALSCHKWIRVILAIPRKERSVPLISRLTRMLSWLDRTWHFCDPSGCGRCLQFAQILLAG
jgi:hypothetical protein